jgi:beta-lactamase class A
MNRLLVKKVAVGIALFLAGAGLEYGIYHQLSRQQPSLGKQVRENSTEFPYINPILYVEVGQKSQFSEYNSYNKNIEKYIHTTVTAEKAKSISVYLRELNSGHWTGIDEDENYAPASLLKVALMIAYLKQAEAMPKLLDKKIKFVGNEDSNQNYKPKHELVIGNYYTVKQLLQDMIVTSSNISNQLLLDNIDTNFLSRVYTDLGIPIPTDDKPDFVSAKTYSTLFRTLYSSTYLTREYSNAALELLSHADFPYGIVAGVPENTIVAHKFGERKYILSESNSENELHECGIVYLPGNPYFLCVMTKGTSFDNLQTVIKDISASTYKFISDLHKND